MTGPGPRRVVAGRYALIGEIGRGGMGVVWRAEDQVIGRQVALKELRLPEGVAAEERTVLEERVLREARSAGRLNDPTVVTVFDVVSDSGVTYLVMELIEAPTLTDLVLDKGPMPVHAAAALGKQVLAALECAHAAGIVHRDVKPSNIMVLPTGRAKLTDFGIARIDEDPRLTSTGAVVGSPGYLAPERIHHGVATPATDLWALGATLYFAVEGHSAFERSNTASTLHAVMTEVPYLSRCQGPLASAIMGLLISTPEARVNPRQAMYLMDLAASNQQSLGATVPAVPGTATYETTPAKPRAKRIAALIGAAVVLAGLAFGGGWLTGTLGSTGTTISHPAMQATWTYGPDGQLPAFALADHNCASGGLQQGRSYPSSVTAPCDQPHDIEVFSAETPLDTNYKLGYPGQTELSRYTEGWCAMLFSSKMITPADKDTSLKFAALVPNASAWTQPKTDESPGNARTLYCVLWSANNAQLSSSALQKST